MGPLSTMRTGNGSLLAFPRAFQSAADLADEELGILAAILQRMNVDFIGTCLG